MFEFYHDGKLVVFTVNGITGGIIFLYIITEIAFLIFTKTLFIHKIFLGLRVRYQVKKMIPKWWYIEEISYITINKKSKNKDCSELKININIYEVYIKVRSKIKTGGRQIYGDNTCYANDWVKVNWLGKIKKEDLTSWIESEDDRHRKEIKQWSRDKILEEIGIN